MRQFAWACLPGFALFAALAWRLGVPSEAALALLGVGLAAFLVGLVRPLALRPLYALLISLAAPIGWVVMRLGLALLFLLVLAPLALLFRLLGRDALGLRSGARWLPGRARRPPTSYYRMS